jgi:putative CocE/NonD family hydrolase
MQWGVTIDLRDGVCLSAILYLPMNHSGPSPTIVTMTPYTAQAYHEVGLYFAQRGYPFVTVDVRGRGNSEGAFEPFASESQDGYDVVEWLARQRYCDGRVAMWGGSYAGYAQWATAQELPPHLATVVPVASPYLGVDFPMRNNIVATYLVRWLTLVAGSTSQDKIFADERFWRERFQRWFASAAAFKELDSIVGYPSETFQNWLAHPRQESYWDAYNPTSDQYANMSIPILTITGSYDGDQPGALTHYRAHLTHATAAACARHYLVIGPWDHAGTRNPQANVAGLSCGPASIIDLKQLHMDWYAWIMQGGPRPAFLQKRVAYYVMGADKWRYTDTLDEITDATGTFYLDSTGAALSIFASGTLQVQRGQGREDTYVHDPRDPTLSAPELTCTDALCLRPTFPTDNLTDQAPVYAGEGRQLIYHSAPLDQDTEISGFFKLSVWMAIDAPDTDFSVRVYCITPDGSSILLTADTLRARYRQSLREERLIDTQEPLRYDFDHFTFVARLLTKGSRLRLTVGPIHSIHSQKNHQSGGVIGEESMNVARPITVKLFHDAARPSALYVPYGRSEV